MQNESTEIMFVTSLFDIPLDTAACIMHISKSRLIALNKIAGNESWPFEEVLFQQSK